MALITTTEALAALCQRLASTDYITVDTEFLRDKTYWPRLCLVQVAGPEEAWCIDPLAKGIDLAPLFELMADENVLKVFHAARQDLEIFQVLTGRLPTPLFDTQIAAMVAGFGEQAGYDTLVAKLAKVQIDKSQRFTDWSRRPLNEKQISYALSDVTHLRTVYERLRKRLDKDGRLAWVGEEMAALSDTSNYITEPREAFRRIKARSKSRRFLGILRELAAWREEEARVRDLPRQRLLKDEALLELAAIAPDGPEELGNCRLVPKGVADGKLGPAIMAAIARGKALPDAELPEPPEDREPPSGIGPITDLLKVLLRMKAETHQVAQRLVASMEDLELLAADDNAPVDCLHGWRFEVFGRDALALKHGRLALALSEDGRRVETIPVEIEG